MPLVTTASLVETLFTLIAGFGVFFPTRIAWRSYQTTRGLWRARQVQRLSITYGTWALSLSGALVVCILAVMAATVMAIFSLVGLIGMLTPPGEPRPGPTGVNLVFRWALVGGLLTVVILKNIAVAVAWRIYSWGESAFAKGEATLG